MQSAAALPVTVVTHSAVSKLLHSCKFSQHIKRKMCPLHRLCCTKLTATLVGTKSDTPFSRLLSRSAINLCFASSVASMFRIFVLQQSFIQRTTSDSFNLHQNYSVLPETQECHRARFARLCSSLKAKLILHCESKKQDTKLLPITSPNVNRSSKFFH